MAKLSRRQLAENTTARLLAGDDRQTVMHQLAAYMITAKMTGQSELIINDIATALQTLTGHSRVMVTSARPLSPTSRKEIESYLTKTLKLKTVELDTAVDASLLGGLILQTPQYELDTTIRTKLAKLARQEQ